MIFRLRAIEFVESGYINIYNLYRVSLFLGVGSVFAILYPFFDKFNNLINSQFLFYFNKFKVQKDQRILNYIRSFILILIFFSFFLYVLINTFDISFIFELLKFPYDQETLILFCLLLPFTPIAIISNFLSLKKSKKFFNSVLIFQIILFCSISYFSLMYAYFYTTLFNLCIFFYIYYQRHLES